MTDTKLVRVELTAWAQYRWSGVVQAPASYAPDDLDRLVDAVYHCVPTADFREARSPRTKGDCVYRHDDLGQDPPVFRVTSHGEIDRILGGRDTQRVYGHCDRCGAPVVDEQRHPGIHEYDVCRLCADHICPDCTVFVDESPHCRECAARERQGGG